MTSGSLTIAPETATVPDEPSPSRRRRLAFWRSPPDQPGWARPALLAVAALAGLLYAWNITSSGLSPYYSVAARSMSVSWKAFLFTAFDPSATLTLDKIGGFLWPQALSVRLFGFHDWALTLPQCIEGIVSVLVMYRVVRRWQGAAAGLIAAELLTVTPVAASMFGHALLDCSLTMCLVLAADQYQKAVMTGRLNPLLLSGLWVGLGFQAKMMQAWIVVPALAVAYLVAAPHGLRRRLGRLLTAGGVLLAVSLSWVALMTFVPESSRPYADGSTNNSAFAMVFGYNGLDRFHEGLIAGSVRPPSQNGSAGSSSDGASEDPPKGSSEGAGGASRGGQGNSGPGTSQSGSGPENSAGSDSGSGAQAQGQAQSSPAMAVLPGSGGWTKLFGSRFATQVGWLYPLALIALVLGLVRHRKAARTDQRRAGYLMWGGWLITSGVVLSAMSIPHTAYAAVLAPPLAALAAAGATVLWRTHRAARGGPRAWLLPAAVVVQEVWTLHIASEYTEFAPWLVPLVIVTSVVACAALVHTAVASGHSRRLVRRIGLIGLASGCVAFLAAPVTWSLSVLDQQYGGSAFDAYAGPPLKPAGGGSGGGASGGGKGPVKSNTLGGRPAASTAQGPEVLDSLSRDQERLVDYARRNNRGATYTFSTNSWEMASRYIYAKALPVLPLGGFTAGANLVTLAEYRDLIRDGSLRFALVGTHEGSMSGTGGGQASEPAPDSSLAQIDKWVKSACTKVDPAAYGARPEDGEDGQETLYDCASAVR
ncbi:ArnT family glycosyltransferase [Streptomyces pseudovenezuelae]|uniref:4-amino-4-deoxy-L-arabinose transferase-like glycosyltransferase n=1 Tax=Streptomyces pseudovenezuelae TaxID=67350 RepID=A0ABT6LXF7_9ACTN|nr:glycosyltransferase family 39 protein [Streptomyces pseudovenezuelae]MDH6220987.1 4-amino-4-deoxy-L-arabinose transferase-like glycosyltransferase [Streptomyces pseudovenezuelae]